MASTYNEYGKYNWKRRFIIHEVSLLFGFQSPVGGGGGVKKTNSRNAAKGGAVCHAEYQLDAGHV